MRRRTQKQGAIAVAALWALFIYASVFSDWLEPAGGSLFAEAHASSYLDATPADPLAAAGANAPATPGLQ